MNVVIFNKDGSIKNLIFDQIIVQGNNGVDEIKCAIEGYGNDSYTLEAVFDLPNGDISSLSGVASTFQVDGSTYNGFKVTLTSRETALPGIVKMSLRASSQYLDRQYTTEINLTINESGYAPEYTDITMSQYENLLSMLSTYQVKYVLNNARFYQSLEAAQADAENLAIYQCVIVANVADPNETIKVYYKNASEELVYLKNLGRNIVSMTPVQLSVTASGAYYYFNVAFDDGSTLTTNSFLCPAGPQGEQGDPAGFGTPQTSTTTFTNPSGTDAAANVNCNAEGPDTEKVMNFDFTFYIPKGADGVITSAPGVIGFQVVNGQLQATVEQGDPSDYLTINSSGKLIYTY